MDPVDPPPPAAPSAPPGQLSSLGTKISADLEATRNDLEQVRELAAEYQRELSGKSNELAGLKQLFEKTRQHLIQLELNVKTLREERHRLANRAMEADALEMKLQKMTAQRDRLLAEIERLRPWRD
jgi:chromosome segregation ATPase